MEQLAEGVWPLEGFPRDAINVYILEDVLIDSGLIFDRRRVLKQASGATITAHALTHAHLDHYGSSAAVCEQLNVPMWCGGADAEMVRVGKMIGPRGLVVPAAPKCRVDRELHEGDEVAGDVIWGCNPFINAGPPQERFPFVSPDPERNRESARRLAELEPALVCFGHGKPLPDTARFKEIVAKLPR